MICVEYSHIAISRYITILVVINNIGLLSARDYQCGDLSYMQNFKILTPLSENDNDYNILIFANCGVMGNWKVKDDLKGQCEKCNRVYDGTGNIRRPFKFLYEKKDNKNERIKVKSITIENSQKKENVTTLEKNAFSLLPGEYIDVFVEYTCDLHSKWFTLKVNVEIEEIANPIIFEYWKICNDNFIHSKDIGYLIMIILIVCSIYISFIDKFNSKVEDEIIKKHNEMRNPENLIIITLVIVILVLMLYIMNLLSIWINLCLLFGIPLSFGILCESIYKGISFSNDKTFNHKNINLPFIGDISKYFILLCIIGLIVFILWMILHNWILCDIIAIGISICTIRLFKFTSLKLLFCLYVIVILYDFIWIYNFSTFYSYNSPLAYNDNNNLPLRIIFPQLISTPFDNCHSLPISDIILPGFFLSYLRLFDENKKMNINSQLTYFNLGLFAIIIGFALNVFVYYIYHLMLPGFLFTGSLALIAILVYVFINGHIKEFFSGFKSTDYGDNTLENIALLSKMKQVEEKNDLRVIKTITEESRESEQFYLKKESYNSMDNKEGIEMMEMTKEN